MLHMVENIKAGIKINLKIDETSIRDNKGISHIFIRKNWRKYRETRVICDIAFLFVKHSAF